MDRNKSDLFNYTKSIQGSNYGSINNDAASNFAVLCRQPNGGSNQIRKEAIFTGGPMKGGAN